MIADHEFDCDGRVVRLTASIGYACVPFLPARPTVLNWEQVLAVADRGLYMVKSNGRNGWVGILSNERTTQTDVSRLPEHCERLVEEGRLEIMSSVAGRTLGLEDPDLEPVR